MQNILDYFNSVIYAIFGSNSFFALLSPNTVYRFLSNPDSPFLSLEDFILRVLSNPSFIFSFFVWTWFAVLVFKLLLVYPFKWIRSVIKR